MSATKVICIITLFLLISSCSMIHFGSTKFAAEFHVAPNGDDADPGSKSKPFQSLERARDAVRDFHKKADAPNRAIAVSLHAGTYRLTQSFQLSSEDSGTTSSPVVYRAYPGETATLSGGRSLPTDAFHPVTNTDILSRLDPAAKSNVLQVNLRSLGIEDYGQLRSLAYSAPIQPIWLELYCDGKAMPLSRWPNTGFVETTTGTTPAIAPAAKDASVNTRLLVPFTDDRPLRWINSPEAHLFGYWSMDWSDQNIQIMEIDAKERLITLNSEGPRVVPGRRYYAFNILEELDAPGEWYLDRKEGLLYFWPPRAISECDIEVTMLKEPLISMHGTRSITIQNLVLENTRGSAIQMVGCSDSLIADCTIRNIGNVGVMVGEGAGGEVVGNYLIYTMDNTMWNQNAGQRNIIRNCNIHATGNAGIILAGGNRSTLEAGGNSAEGNHIWNFGRVGRTYQPGIFLAGVGNRASRNLIHDAPHAAILFFGNEHLIEDNEIHNVCQETSDVGAIYTGKDYSARGNIVRNNFLHHITGFDKKGSVAIYLDDMASGTTIYGNTIYANALAMLIGSGRDNVVEKNLIIECGRSIALDDRVLNWLRSAVEQPDGICIQRLCAARYDQPPYSIRYPELAAISLDQMGSPAGNRIQQNLIIATRDIEVADGAKKVSTTAENTLVAPLADDNPAHLSTTVSLTTPQWRGAFENYDRMKFKIRPNSALSKWAK